MNKIYDLVSFYTKNKKRNSVSAKEYCKIESEKNGNITTKSFTFINDCKSCNIEIDFTFNNWKKSNYLFIPSSVYNGNRFSSKRYIYPPFISKENINDDIHITDIPRLSKEEITSVIHLTSADMATPCCGFFDFDINEAYFVFLKAQNSLGNIGIKFKENLKMKTANLTIQTPCVREENQYFFGFDSDKKERIIGRTNYPSKDKAFNFSKDDVVEILYSEICCKCGDLNEFFKIYFNNRNIFRNIDKNSCKISYSKSFDIIEEKYNLENYNSNYGYYRLGTIDNIYQDYQSGWTGGGINSFPLLLNGNKVSKERALNTLKFIVNKIQNENGFYRAVYYNGNFYGDNYDDTDNKNILLIRKHCDLTYFLIKQYKICKEEFLLVSIKKACNAIVNFYKKNGELGQFIDIDKMEIYLSKSASGSLAIGVLAFAFQLFDDKEYLDTSKKLANHYYIENVSKGICNGGPGDIIGCVDSESIFGLLEGFVSLYEVCGETQYLNYAINTAYQCSTWVVSYNYDFPKSSMLSKLNIKTLGSVFANIQNKHSAPGICTLSGDCLIRLYEYTNNTAFLDLIEDIASNITQYLSTKERIIFSQDKIPLNSGYINERVNMSDWEGQNFVGEVFNGSTWAEVACLLTCIEIPSLYIDLQNNLVKVFDRINYKINSNRIKIINKDNYKKTIKIKIRNQEPRILEINSMDTVEVEYYENIKKTC